MLFSPSSDETTLSPLNYSDDDYELRKNTGRSKFDVPDSTSAVGNDDDGDGSRRDYGDYDQGSRRNYGDFEQDGSSTAKKLGIVAAGVVMMMAIVGTVGYVMVAKTKFSGEIQMQRESITNSTSTSLPSTTTLATSPSLLTTSSSSSTTTTTTTTTTTQAVKQKCKTVLQQGACNCPGGKRPERPAEIKEISLCLVVDTTKSMTPILQQLKTEIKKFLTQNAKYKVFSEFIVIPFKDDVGKITQTKDMKIAQKAVNVLIANGGGYCREGVINALYRAAFIAKEGSMMYLFTDATANDLQYEAPLVDSLKQKHMSVVMALSKTYHFCSGKRGFKTPHFPPYDRITAVNSGLMIILEETQVATMLRFMTAALKRGLNALKNIPSRVKGIDHARKKDEKCKCLPPKKVKKCIIITI